MLSVFDIASEMVMQWREFKWQIVWVQYYVCLNIEGLYGGFRNLVFNKIIGAYS